MHYALFDGRLSNTDPLATLAIAAATCLYDQRDSRPEQSPLFKVS